jgi:hypothetical protein
MDKSSLEAIVESLEAEGVRYLIAGGLAVVAHGFVRLTVDVDIILDLSRDNVLRAVRAFGRVGYRPRAPVPFESFADPGERRRWVEEKGMRVFSLYSADSPLTEVDLFVQPPFADFEAALSRAVRMPIREGLEAVFVGLDDLLALKRAAGRPKDLMDIENLERIHREEGEDDRGA